MDFAEEFEAVACRWCDKLMPPAEEFADGVCTECYRLLRSAGVSDEEIFQDFK